MSIASRRACNCGVSLVVQVATGHTAPAYSDGMRTIKERSRDYITILMEQIKTTKTKNGNPVQFGLQPYINEMQANIARAYTIVQATAKANTIQSRLDCLRWTKHKEYKKNTRGTYKLIGHGLNATNEKVRCLNAPRMQ